MTRLTSIEVGEGAGGFTLDLVTEAGDRLSFRLDEEQLDVLADHIDDLLGTASDA